MKSILKEIQEKVAELEHQQWVHWTEYMLENLTKENIKRWKRQIKTPYSELSEKEKKSDREWAKKTMSLIIPKLKKEFGRIIEDWHKICSDIIKKELFKEINKIK